MDLSIPGTFYPRALPPGLTWLLFSVVVLGGLAFGVRLGKGRGWTRSLQAGMAGGMVLLLLTMVTAMILTFLFYSD